MKTRFIHLVMATIFLCMTCPVYASTQGKTELSPYFGFSFPYEYGSVQPSDAPLVGIRIGHFFSDQVSAELSVQKGFSEANNQAPFSGEKFIMEAYRMNLLYNFFPTKVVRPFVTAGGGIERVNSDTLDAQYDLSVNGGVGLRFFAGDDAGFRVEGRYVGSKVDDGIYIDNDWQSNAELMAGFFFLFGSKKQGEDEKDTDQDGVADNVDQCADSPRGADVDAQGCEIDLESQGEDHALNDADADGIEDQVDQCAKTPQGAVVDELGCPVDQDQDGVADGIDQCPDTAADQKVDQKGCPQKSKARGVLEGVNFELNSLELTPNAMEVLKEVALELKKFPEVEVEIQGHTDNTGDPNYNLLLSQSRAEAVRDYLISVGIPEKQVSAKGYGPQVPRADNSTKEGREKNRRVEIDWID
ncbi:MAG: OmpA family protein [Bdellovibrionales bacterium]|nr:OmpA family protein [Bdellovibrionales bacterium]